MKKKVKATSAVSSSSSSVSDTDAVENAKNNSLRLTVNKKYATEYQQRKEREELRQQQQQHEQRNSMIMDYPDDDEDGDDDSSDEEEDDDGALLTPSVEVQFLKTIKALRKKENSIYDPDTRFFDEVGTTNDDDGNNNARDNDDASNDDDDDDDDGGPKKPRKPLRFKDVIREQILQQIDGEEKQNQGQKSSGDSRSKLAYDEQQEELRRAFLKESSNIGDDTGRSGKDGHGDDDNDDGDGWMVVKKRAAPAKDTAIEKEASDHLKEIEKLSTKNDTFKDPRGEIEDGDRFLLDFIKNKKWIDRNHYDDDDQANDKPSSASKNGDVDYEKDDDESSLDDVDRADDFEASYNFRFEQAAAQTASSGVLASVQTYARGQTMNTVRRPDTARKDKRQERKERKAAERKAKEEQLKRLKNAKRREMDQKLAQVKAVIGAVDDDEIDEVAIMKMLEGDYEPETFENAMKQTYGDEFYSKEDVEWKTDLDVRQSLKEDDEGDDVVGQDDANGGMYDTYMDDREENEEDQTEEDDDDYDETMEWEEDENEDHDLAATREESELESKIKSKIQDELYKLDYEDIVAGMPTRFRYRQVEPNDYGLTTQEILFARDSSLKQFVSLKKLAPYNDQGEFFPGSKKRRRFREMLKQELEELIPEQADEETPKELDVVNNENRKDGKSTTKDSERNKKKRRRHKKGKKKSGSAEEEKRPLDSEIDLNKVGNQNSKVDKESSTNGTKRKRKKSGKKGEAAHGASAVGEIRERADAETERPENEGNSDKNSVRSPAYSSTSIIGSTSHQATERNCFPGDELMTRKNKRKRAKKDKIAGLSSSRLATYGL